MNDITLFHSTVVEQTSILHYAYLKVVISNIDEAMKIHSLYKEFYRFSPMNIGASDKAQLTELGLIPASCKVHTDESKVAERKFLQFRILLMTYNIMQVAYGDTGCVFHYFNQQSV